MAIEANAKINLTERAIKHVKEYLAKNGPGIGMRFGVKKTGCSGYAYVLEVAIEKKSDDHAFELDDGLVLLVDDSSLPFLKGTTLDYVREGLNSGFKFINPNEKGSCGCGESFNV